MDFAERKTQNLSQIRQAAGFLRARLAGRSPEIGIILGSGLSGAVPTLKDPAVVPYDEIPGFPRTTVSGHEGKLIVGDWAPARSGLSLGVAVMQGRFHYYEGHLMESIGLPLRVLRELGVRRLLSTSAVGSLKRSIRPGDIVVLKDHMNFMGINPLRGFHQKEFGEMFPDMGSAYTPALRKAALQVCRRLKIPVTEGVYAAVAGPSYETPSEIRAFAMLGGDVVGMSTAPEVIISRQMGLEVLGLSWISNMAAGLSKETLSHPDVLALGKRMSERLRLIIEALLDRFIEEG